MLSIKNVFASYGGSLVLQGVNLSISEKEVKALMGRNGVGKTTLLRTVMGFLPLRSGEIFFDGQPIHRLQTYEIANLGLSYVPQGREIFAEFTVLENLRLGMLKSARSSRKIPEEIFEYFPILAERKNQKAGTFSGGEQQMLAIARALATHPKMLLLDEPSEGVQPSIIDHISEILKKVNREMALTILLVEQNVDMVLDIADSCAIMEKGRIVEDCTIEIIRQDESIIGRHMGL